MTPRALASAAVAIAVLTLPAAAKADGPPVGFMTDGGVTAGSIRYAALPAGHGTLIEKLALNGGRPLRFRYFKHPVGVAMIATDGSAGGISHDGRTLVLGAPRTSYPQLHSTLYVLSSRTLRVRRRISLKGDFSYDAMSPDGRTIYLIQLSSTGDFLRYAVRAFDTRSRRLVREPVVDRREPDEVMRGFPLTRVMSPDGRYAYTLYGGGKTPFVHALDTTRRSAACIDLPAMPDGALYKLRLNGKRLTVIADDNPIAVVNTTTRQVSKAPPARPVKQAPADDGGGSGVGAWLLLAGAAAALAAIVAIGARRWRARTTA